jgi:peptidoglycan/xylan/chitin deacetylase (PgdA/CDA1 family)
MLHRVSPGVPHELQSNRGLKVAPEFLRQFLGGVRESGYRFISLDELFARLTAGESLAGLAVITLDDGYADNHTIAYPIFRGMGVPFTIYVTTCFPEGTAILWWYWLEQVLQRCERVELQDGTRLEAGTDAEKNRVFLQLRQMIVNHGDAGQAEFLRSLVKNNAVDIGRVSRDLAMTWDQIEELSRDELVTIGGHTASHVSLAALTESQMRTEVLEGNALLTKHTGRPVEHFAYPYGGRLEAGAREFQVLKTLGMKTVVTTRRGTLYPSHRDHLECLPRINVDEAFRVADIGRIRRQIVVTD